MAVVFPRSQKYNQWKTINILFKEAFVRIFLPSAALFHKTLAYLVPKKGK